MPVSDDRLILLDRVCTLYYERNRSQDEIAAELGTSRSSISRLLDEARREGLIEIRVKHPLPRSSELENELICRFALLEARILLTGDRKFEENLQRLGMLGAHYLQSILHNDQILAMSWGAALAEVVRAISLPSPILVEVVQVIGSIGSANPEIDGTELARRLAQKLGGRYRYLNAPLVVESAHIRDALQQEKSIAEAIAVARRADVALAGIGSVTPRISSLLRAGYLTRAQLAQLQKSGAVGDIFCRHFDINGRLLPTEINNRIVGLDMEILRRIPRIIGVAGGRDKSPAILGALRGHHINVLISDEDAVRAVLALDESHPLDRPDTDAHSKRIK